MEVGNIAGTKKLNVNNGSSKDGGAELLAGEITGTTANDNYNFGKYNDAEVTGIAFGEGDDTLTLGDYTDLDVAGMLDFGSGKKDKLSIGKGATMSVDELNVSSLDTLSMSKGAILAIGDADDLADAKEKWSKYANQIVSKA